MTGHGRRLRWVGVWATALFAGSAGPAAANGHAAGAPVPATQEIEILDPGVDPTGKPAVVLQPGYGGIRQVTVPPAVIVHRYFYTGDRTFQGPMLPGGPTVVTVNHPKTLERVYVPVTMPPGAPKVTYTSDSIRYDYGPQSVTLTFGLCGKPTVHYSQSTKIGEKARELVVNAAATSKELIRRTGIPEGTRRLADGTRQVVAAGFDTVGNVGKVVLSPIGKGFRSVTNSPEPPPADAARPAFLPVAPTKLPPPIGRPDPDTLFTPRAP